jgi:hypothetical protein
MKDEDGFDEMFEFEEEALQYFQMEYDSDSEQVEGAAGIL